MSELAKIILGIMMVFTILVIIGFIEEQSERANINTS